MAEQKRAKLKDILKLIFYVWMLFLALALMIEGGKRVYHAYKTLPERFEEQRNIQREKLCKTHGANMNEFYGRDVCASPEEYED